MDQDDTSPQLEYVESQRNRRLLAMDPGLGSVCWCRHCHQFGVDLGGIQMRMDLAGFQSLVVLLHRAAANYELWVEPAEDAV